MRQAQNRLRVDDDAWFDRFFRDLGFTMLGAFGAMVLIAWMVTR